MVMKSSRQDKQLEKQGQNASNMADIANDLWRFKVYGPTKKKKQEQEQENVGGQEELKEKKLFTRNVQRTNVLNDPFLLEEAGKRKSMTMEQL